MGRKKKDDTIAVLSESFGITRKMRQDMRIAAMELGDDEVRFLVNAYYEMQGNRIRAAAQERELAKADKPNQAIAAIRYLSHDLEDLIKTGLDWYSKHHADGEWLRSVVGIGPVIAAGLLAHIDITKCDTAGKLWAYAGYDPTREWKKGERRPWNGRLKLICWKAGESFVKMSGHDDCYYGQVYKERRVYEDERNERGDLAEQAELILQKKKYRKTTDAFKAYSQGQLPKAHLYSRAKRYAVKLFLSHLHDDLYRRHYDQEPPLPYPIWSDKLPTHTHMKERPVW